MENQKRKERREEEKEKNKKEKEKEEKPFEIRFYGPPKKGETVGPLISEKEATKASRKIAKKNKERQEERLQQMLNQVWLQQFTIRRKLFIREVEKTSEQKQSLLIELFVPNQVEEEQEREPEPVLSQEMFF